MGSLCLNGGHIVVLTVLPLQGEVAAEQAEGARGTEVARLEGEDSEWVPSA